MFAEKDVPVQEASFVVCLRRKFVILIFCKDSGVLSCVKRRRQKAQVAGTDIGHQAKLFYFL